MDGVSCVPLHDARGYSRVGLRQHRACCPITIWFMDARVSACALDKTHKQHTVLPITSPRMIRGWGLDLWAGNPDRGGPGWLDRMFLFLSGASYGLPMRARRRHVERMKGLRDYPPTRPYQFERVRRRGHAVRLNSVDFVERKAYSMFVKFFPSGLGPLYGKYPPSTHRAFVVRMKEGGEMISINCSDEVTT